MSAAWRATACALIGAALILVTPRPAQSQSRIFVENFDGFFGRFSTYSVASNANWTPANSGAQINGFQSNEPSNDWLISPALDLSYTDAETLSFFVAKRFADSDDLKIKVSTDYDGRGDPTTATWTEVGTVESASGSETVTETPSIDLSSVSGGSEVYVAFHYTSSGTTAGNVAQYKIDNVEVTATLSRPVVQFNSTGKIIAEDDGSFWVQVRLIGPNPPDSIVVDIALQDEGSTADASDLANFSPITVMFDSTDGSGSAWNQRIGVTDDADVEGNERAQLELANLVASGDVTLGSQDRFNALIVGDDRTIHDGLTALRDRRPTDIILEGTVTRAFGSYARLQDESGATGASAIVIRQAAGGNSPSFQQDIEEGRIRPGTQLRVQGRLSHFNGLSQINNEDLTRYSIQGQGAVPPPQEVTLSALTGPDGEDYENELVEVSGLQFRNVSSGDTFESSTTYEVTDGTTTFPFEVRSEGESALVGAAIPTGTFTFRDIVGQFNEGGSVTDDTGYRLFGIRPATALPVEIGTFRAQRKGESVRLSWSTLSETNNAGFEVQRQKGGASDWTDIGFVESRISGGTTQNPQSYRFTDENLPYVADTLRYRLRQVDVDGRAETTAPVAITQSADDVELKPTFPNPARTQATIRFGVPDREEVDLALYDMMGRELRTLHNGPLKGRQEVQVDLSGLASGTYFLRLRAGEEARTRQITVVR